MGIIGDQINFHIHIPHPHIPHPHLPLHHRCVKERDLIPKGYVGILVGQGEEQERFLIPVFYINHPLFTQLLKDAEEEYGFDRNGPITIPCLADHFRGVQNTIEKENSISHHHQHHHNPNFLDRCFRP